MRWVPVTSQLVPIASCLYDVRKLARLVKMPVSIIACRQSTTAAMYHRLQLPSSPVRRLSGCVLLMLASVGMLLLSGCFGSPGDALLNEKLGGDTTAYSADRNAFSQSARNLTNEQRRTFEVGDSFFELNWVTAPASTDARDGLGPTFNAQSCSSCHVLDGRAKPPERVDDPERGLLLRLSMPDLHGGDVPVPIPQYGEQLQDRAIHGVAPEGSFEVRYVEVPGTFADGTEYSLLEPVYVFSDLAYGELPPDVMVSPRIAPTIVGMGLLEAIDVSELMVHADPDDIDGDGVSGRVNMVWDEVQGDIVVGRFGWKANEGSLMQQAMTAFFEDIGITSFLHPDENCPETQVDCAAAPNGGEPEIPTGRAEKLLLYVRTLAVPAMRNIDDPMVRDGAGLFLAAECSSCHVPTYETGEAEIEALSNQTIHPFTDLLLHDMGPGLADGRPDNLASGSEWRTPPLWGLGLLEAVNGHTRLLHDGRARSFSEAILWHGGEAMKSRDAFLDMSKDERDALIAFLRSL